MSAFLLFYFNYSSMTLQFHAFLHLSVDFNYKLSLILLMIHLAFPTNYYLTVIINYIYTHDYIC